MTIIKKKDLKKFKPEELDELVDADGSPIEGDRNPTNDSEIEVSPQQTTDDFAATAIQPNRTLTGYGGSAYGTRRVGEEKVINIINKIMENDISQASGFEELSRNKPIVANKSQEIVSTISKNNLNGQEIAALLDFILSNIDMNNIPQELRNVLKSKL